MNRDEILSELTSSLEEMFDINPASVTLEARLREDLDLDSIDAIDLAVRLKKLLGRRVELSVLKDLKTVSDVVVLIEKEISAAGKAPLGADSADDGASPDAETEDTESSSTSATKTPGG